jgi:methionyl-tRNA synthetase
MSRFYITTAIDYVNAKPHVGHALEKVLTDTVARFRRLRGEETYFLTGTDENSLKNVQGAEKAGKPVGEFVAENAETFRDLGKLLNLSFDGFIRTTEARHFAGAEKLWRAFKAEDVYTKKYSGLYCVGCEEYKLPKDLVDGKCPDHQKEPEVVEEGNYFFRLSAYADILKQKIEGGELRIVPEFRKNEVLSFISMGLEDFSISRSVARAKGWGVPVPDDSSQIMYVWVDALSNYITAIDYANDGELYKKFWASESERTHVIGKGILRFHAVYWPAMLLSARLPLPTTIYAHEYLTVDGQKMSKSLGNIIDPADVVAKYGVDGARYILLSSLPFSNDGDVSWKKFTEKYNADLANGLGNLVSRVMKLGEKITNYELRITNEEFPKEFSELLGSYRLSEGLEYIWNLIREDNKYIEDEKPWELVRTNSEKFEAVMKKLLEDLGNIAVLLAPFLPETSEKIQGMLAERKGGILFQRIV